MVCVLWQSETETNRGTQDKTIGRGAAVVHSGSPVSSPDFPTLSMNTWASQLSFFLSLTSPTFPRVSRLPSCVTPSCRSVHLPFSSVSVSLWLSAWLTQGITPSPNTAELKQTHFATVKINHFLFFFSLSLFLFPSLPFSLSQAPLFSRSENKLLGLYLFYVGRPDHRRVSLGHFNLNLLNFPVTT